MFSISIGYKKLDTSEKWYYRGGIEEMFTRDFSNAMLFESKQAAQIIATMIDCILRAGDDGRCCFTIAEEKIEETNS